MSKSKIERLRDQTYNEAIELLDTYGQCAIIRPTGFGKTGLLTRVIKSGKYKKIIYLYPADVIKNTVLDFYNDWKSRDPISNVIFMSYRKLIMLEESDLKNLKDVDLIICDECHRLGAAETMRGINELIALPAKPHILGATATPERMDMIDEIAMFFDDHMTSRYTLHEAFNDKVLQKPIYTFCAYGASDPEVLANIKKEAMLEVNNLDGPDREYAKELLESHMVELATITKMDYVLRSTLAKYNADTTYQKYIVFFRDFNHIKQAKKQVRGWFNKAFPNHTIDELVVTSENTENRNNVDKLDELPYKTNHIDLIYTCDMLNMGYHVGSITGILMYRGTHSSTIYAQQLGRVLSSGDSKPKFVFDIVDNLHRKSVYSMLNDNVNANANLSNAEMIEYKELVKRTADKDADNQPIPLTPAEMERLIYLSKKLKDYNDYQTGKIGNNTLYKSDLVVTSYEGEVKEIIAKTDAEPRAMVCRQAWARWIEKGGDDSVKTRAYVLAQQQPTGVPLKPFCEVKNVTVNMVLREMHIA